MQKKNLRTFFIIEDKICEVLDGCLCQKLCSNGARNSGINEWVKRGNYRLSEGYQLWIGRRHVALVRECRIKMQSPSLNQEVQLQKKAKH